MSKPLIYFLCTGNSCRSQMAEGWARHLADGRWEVASAGIAPSFVHPRAVAAMAEVGGDISGQRSKPIDPQLLRRAAVVVTLCGEAEESCPATPPGVRRLHWPLPDPARVQGDEETVRQAFRQVRDELGRRVRELLAELPPPQEPH